MTLTVGDIQKKHTELTAPGAMFELHDVTLDGHVYTAFKNAQDTLTAVLQAGRTHGDKEFLVYDDERYSFNRFYADVDALAACMQHDYSIQSGDRVANAMRNNPEWAITFVAAVLIGAIPVPINSWGKTEELEYAVDDSGAKILVCDQERATLITDSQKLPTCKVVVTRASDTFLQANTLGSLEDAIAKNRDRDYSTASPDNADPCLILYTSGSTGVPKGVVVRHIAMTQALMHGMFFGMLAMALDGPTELRGGATRDTTLATVPLFHATGLIGGLITPLLFGHRSVMMYKWDAQKALQIIEQEKITAFATVPTVLQDLLNHPEFDNFNTASLQRLGYGGAAAPETLHDTIKRKIQNTIRAQGWGMTETTGVGAIMVGGLCQLAPNSAGLPSPLVDLRFVNSEGRQVDTGEIGEIEVRSVCCTPGYWKKPEASAAIFSDDRWMKTGDLGRLDENGYLHITGRIKEIVIRGGENIYPGEIEAVAYSLDGVHEAVVFGVPDDTMGEELAMVLYLEGGSDLNETSIRGALKERLAGYKVPRYIDISATALPQNASGKLHKMKVREAFLKNC